MTLNAKQIPGAGRKQIDPVDAGTYPARLVQILTLGVQKQRSYKGEEKPPVLEFMLTYEMLDEFMKDDDGEDIEDKPRWISETMPFYNLDTDKAKSSKRYYALDPDVKHGGDWGTLITTPCMITITHNEGVGKNAGRIYENIASVSAMRPKEAAKAPDLVNEPRIFDFYNPNMEVFNNLPEWLQTKMKEAIDFPGSALEEALERKAVGDVEPKKVAKKEKAAPVVEQPEDEGEW
jgi:hypothetical protein